MKQSDDFNESWPWVAVCLALALVVCLGAPAAAQTPIGTVGLSAGWGTFGQAVPQGMASTALQVGSFPTQTDVKTRWPDNSIRFAVVTVHATSSGTFPITPAASAGGSFAPTLPLASVALVIGGVTYTAALPAAPSADLWLSGPLAYEGRSVVTPVSGGTPHPFLRVNFDTRVYNDGGGRVDVSIENVLDIAGATAVTYDVDIVVNGVSRFAKTAIQHFYLTRWRKTFAIGPTTFATVTPDMTPFNTSRALPPYLPIVTNRVDAITDSARYEILASGALDTDMSAHGGRGALAPYPDWTARYLVHKDPAQRAFVLANGDLAGSWPVHVREAEASPLTGVGSGRFVSLDQRPTIWYDQRAQESGVDYVKGLPLPIREYTFLCSPPPAVPEPGCQSPQAGQTRLIPDNAHQPSLAYVPYLLTGDRYYADEMAFWADYAMIRTYNGDGVRGSLGILAYNEVRGFGWALRNIADAAAYHPDTAVRSYLAEKVNANLQWLDNYANTQDPVANPLKLLWIGARPEIGFISLWEQTYLAYAIDRANRLGFTGGLAHRDAIANLQLKLFSSAPAYPRETVVSSAITLPDGTVVPAGTVLTWSAPYIVGSGTPNPAGGFTYNKTMADVWTQTSDLSLQRNFAGYYGPEARMNLMIGIEAGWTGAQNAYDYLWPFIGVTNFWGTLSSPVPDLAERAGWALDFYASAGTSPPSSPAPAPAQLLTPTTGATFGSSAQSFTWTAGTGVTSYRLDLGTTQGSTNLHAGVESAAQSEYVTGLPVNGSTVWVRLSSRIDGVLQFTDYSFSSYTAAVVGPPPALAPGPIVAVAGNDTVVTAPFDTAAGDVLVAFVSSSGPDTGGETMSVTGGGLAWTLVSRTNVQLGVSEIWTATTPTARTGLTVTSTHTLSTTDQALVVVPFSGAAGVGASASANAASGGPSVSLTTTRAGSLIYAVGNDWNGAVPRTLGANQAMVNEVLGINGDTFWVQRLTGTSGAAGSLVTLNDTGPTDHSWNFGAVEIIPASGASKSIPSIIWATPSDIIRGTPLTVAQLNATASVPGTCVYTPPAGTLLNTGSGQILSVTFYPTDTATYQLATAAVLLNVLPGAPTVTWNAPAPITFNTPLSSTQLNATADLPGAFSYSRPLGTALPLGTILPAGNWTLWVTFTPTNPLYAPITTSVPLTVLKQTPVITWPTPANIVTGTPLSGTQLNASATVGGTNAAGTFVYTNASGTVVVAGTVLPAGPGQRLSVTFTPTDTANVATATAAVAITVAAASAPATPTPAKIGNLIPGTFNDATGHSGQSHLVFSPNTNRWWLFTLSSNNDAFGNHKVLSYVSSGSDLATATWTAAAIGPDLFNAGGATDSLLAGGRSLGVALRTIGSTDYVHVFASAATDGQVSSNGHIRAQLGAGSISWGAWDNPGSPNTASQWQGPLGTGASGASTHPSWGNAVGISTGGYIHHFSVTMDQEVDCAVGRSTNQDNATAWANGFGTNTSPTGNAGTSPPWTTAVIDKTMVHECKVLAFAPLASDVMLAVYSNGGTSTVVQPQLTNLRYQKSGASGTWTNISASSGGGNGTVFASDATIDQNDWALVPVSPTTIYTFRKNGTAVEGVSYNAGANNWSAMSGATAPPAFGTGQAFKSGGGLFGATDGANVWLFVIGTDAANSILFTKFNGTSWTTWAPVPGTTSGTQTRGFITGYRTLSSNQIGLAWTQGTSAFDVMTTSLNTSGVAASSPVAATLTAPSTGSIVSGATSVTATASSTAGAIAGVQFLLDGVSLGVEDTISPYSVTWNTTATTNGTHFLTAVARDNTGASASSQTVTVTVSNDTTSPTVVMTAPSNGASVAGTIVVAANAADDIGVVGVQFLLDGSPLGAEVTTVPYAINWNSATVASGAHTLAARARDAAAHQTLSAAVSVTTSANRVTPTITWAPPAAVVYGTPLGAAQFNATVNAPGTLTYAPAVGTVLPVGTNQPLSVTFTPTDPASFTTAAANVSITVTKATPLITWPAPADIVYGTTLSATHLNATTSVAGTFAYTPALGTMLSAGVGQTLSATFTPADLANYSVTTATVLINVSKATPAISWPTPAAIVYGTALGATQLNATSSVAGSFAYTPALGTVLSAGAGQTLSATFTPADAANYSPTTAAVLINVSKVTPAITWPTPADIIYGTPLSVTQLNATTSVAGSFAYTPALGTVLSAGAGQTLSAAFTPADTANYTTVTRTVSINVGKATPTITWSTPAAIVSGTALGASQLNASASVAGTFVYSPAAGTLLPVGAAQNLSATFTPADGANYTTATAAVTIAVTQPNRAPALANPGDQTTADRTGYVETIVADAPVQYLRLGDAGGTTAFDASGFGRTGTYRGVIGYGQAGAINDGTTGVTLDGANGSYIDAGPPVFSVGVGGLSVETWIKTTNGDGVRRHIADNKGGSSNLAGVNLAIQSGRVYAKVANGSAQITVVTGRVNLNDGAWHHIAAVLERLYDSVHDRLVIYVDGVVDGTGTLPAAGWNVTSPRNFEIGRLQGINGFSFIGALDEWAVYDVALSASQVATHYARRADGGTIVALQLIATDPDGDGLTYSASGLPSGLTVNAATGLISGTLSPTSAGTSQVTVTASDGILATSQTFTWTVTHLNRAPTLSNPGNQASAENATIVLQLAASDSDGDTLTYTATGLPSGLTVNSATGVIFGFLSFTSAGSYPVTITASDGRVSTSQTFTWTVANIDRAPILANPGDQTMADRTGYLETIVADTPVQYLRLGEAGGATAFDASGIGRTGTYRGVIGYGQAGAINDGTTGVALDGANGTYIDAGPPVISLGVGGLSVETWIKTTNADGLRRYIADNKTGGSNLAGVNLAIQSGRIFAKVANGTAQVTVVTNRVNLNDGAWHHVAAVMERLFDGSHDRLVIYVDGVVDGTGTLPATGWNVTSTRNIEIGRVLDTNGSSFIGALDEWAVYDVALSASQVVTHYGRRVGGATVVALQLIATDPDGDGLTYSATGLPSGLTINSSTGLISGTLSPTSAATSQVTVSVSDGSLATSQTFMWAVAHLNRAPTLSSPGNQVSAENTTIVLQVAASDPDGDPLTYSATGLPSALTLNPTTGVISGTLSFTSAGSYPVTIAVSDGHLSTSQTFTWTVANIDQAPILANPGNQTSAAATEYVATVQADAPVQYLRLGEAVGATAFDASGIGRNGTYRGVIAYGQPSAVNDGTTAVALDGSNGTYIDAGPPVFSVGVGGLSIETWIKTTNADGVRRHIADNKGGSSNLAGVNLAIQSGRVYAKVANGTAQVTVLGSRVNLNDGAWHHVAAVLERYYDGVHDRLVIYVDGVADGTGTLPAAGWNVTSPRNIEIGRLLGTNGFSFIGAIDEWAVYDVALSATQVATHYARRVGGGTVVALQMAATDPDGDVVTYSATGLPAPLTIDPTTGLISGTLGVGSAGTYTVTVTASDGASSASQTFTWTITSGSL